MASGWSTQEGASLTRPPGFNGKDYAYWKERMRIFIEGVDIEVWEAVVNGPYIPTHLVNGVTTVKERIDWNDEDKRKVQHNLRAKNIITSALSPDEFFRISNCKTAQEMWDNLQVTHEGTSEVKRARTNTLIREYELFRMNPGESVQEMQKRFTHIVNQLNSLGKTFPGEDLINKVLRCLNREWQPKVTAISESRNLATMTLATLFGKLQEHELELNRLSEHEENYKKKKSLALKASSSNQHDSDDSQNEDDEGDENMALMVRKFKKFMRRNNTPKQSFSSKRFSNKESSSSTPTCYECGKPGHIKIDCPSLQRKESKYEKKGFKESKGRKAYVAWGDSDADSSDDTNDEEAQFALMATHGGDKESNDEVCFKVRGADWYLDSGCSKHMTGDITKFLSLTPRSSGYVTYGDNNRGRILGTGKVGKNFSSSIDNVLYVEGLRHSLLSISQLCDKGNRVIFDSGSCIIEDKKTKQVRMIGNRVENIYMINLEEVSSHNACCLISTEENSWIWHRRAAHIHMDHLNKLVSKELVNGLPKIKFEKDRLCDACQKGKQVKVSFKSKNIVSTNKPLQLLHMDLFGPTRTKSFGGNYYALVIVDDYSRYTWTLFLANKSDAFAAFKKLARNVQNERELKIMSIRTDHGGEFENEKFESFCEELGIDHNFSAPRTPQQNGVVERKNRSLEELARTMLNDHDIPKYFWADAVSTACYVMNRVLIRPILKKTPYELFKGRKPNISHLHAFGCKCFVLNNGKESLGKFDAKADEGIFLGYSLSSKAFRVYNKRNKVIEESIHVTFEESNPKRLGKVIDDVADELGALQLNEEKKGATKEKEAESSSQQEDEKEPSSELPKEWRIPRDHQIENIIGDVSKGVTTRNSLRNACNHLAFVSQIEPSKIDEAIEDEHWVMAMQEELNQFERNDVWDLVPRPENHQIIGTRWVFRNKLDESGIIVRNKARLVAKGYNQEEGIDYDETYAPVARLEAIRMLLAFASIMDFKLYQMDVKSAFLNGFIQEEVYVEQPPGFENFEKPDHVFKLKKALYGLKQAPRAWYERLSKFLLNHNFQRGKVDTTLFIKKSTGDILLVQIYVDDIIFGATNESLCKEFSSIMQNEFEMSMMGELNFFLGLQIKQSKSGIFISQTKYCKELLKRFEMDKAKEMATPMGTSCYLDKDEEGKPVEVSKYRGMIGSLLYLTASRPDIMFSVCMCARYQANPRESHLAAVKRIMRYLVGTQNVGLWYPKGATCSLVGYSDSDFAGCKLDRKSTSGTCHILGSALVSWHSKKQVSVALSTAEAEYVAAGSCCAQILWMKQQLLDYGVELDHIPIKCDNTSAINLTKNPVQHSRTKHIEIRHHFLRDHVQKGDCVIEFVESAKQLADIFTKPLQKESFFYIRRELGIIDSSSV